MAKTFLLFFSFKEILFTSFHREWCRFETFWTFRRNDNWQRHVICFQLFLVTNTVTAFKPRFCPQSYNELYWTLLSWFSVILLKVFSFLLLQVIPLSWELKVTTGLSVEIHGVCSWCDQALKEYVFKSKRGISFPLSYKNFWGDTSLELL